MASSSTLRALGIAAQSGGNYFSTIHAEAQRTKRLVEARAEADKRYKQGRDDKKDDTAADREYTEGLTAEQRKQKLVDDALARERSLADKKTAVDYQMESQRTTSATALKNKIDEAEKHSTSETLYNISTGEPMTVLVDSYGNYPDDINLREFSKDKPASSSTKEPTDASKKLKMQWKDATQARGMQVKLEEDGHNPAATVGRIWDDVATGSKWTNWMASEEGQAYKAAGTKVVEAFLRLATGAAAPEPEQERYNYMLLTQAGDDKRTVRTKRALLDQSLKSLGEAVNGGASHEEVKDNFKATIDKAAKEGNFYKSKEGEVYKNGDSSSVQQENTNNINLSRRQQLMSQYLSVGESNE